MVPREFEWERRDVQEWMVERVPSFGIALSYSSPQRRHQCQLHAERDVSTDVDLVVSDGKAESKPCLCPI